MVERNILFAGLMADLDRVGEFEGIDNFSPGLSSLALDEGSSLGMQAGNCDSLTVSFGRKDILVAQESL